MSEPPLAALLDSLPHVVHPGSVGGPDTTAVAPATVQDVALVMAAATREGATVGIVGAGTHQGFGYPIAPDVALSTTGISGIIDWEPEDLTITVRAGTIIDEMNGVLEEERQTAVLPEDTGDATVGGVVAAGLSGWRRLRYGPTRDRVIEVELVTGDGRVVHAGGRVVKNVTGYDIARLATGSFGSLGVIVSLSFKLWPQPATKANVLVDSVETANRAFRPQAVLEEAGGVRVYLGGTDREVAGETAALGGEMSDGHQWPASAIGDHRLVMRLPPMAMAEGITELKRTLPGANYVAAHGVGEIRIDGSPTAPDAVRSLRAYAEKRGGSLVVAHGPDAFRLEVDPWGTPPTTLDLQRRVKAAFDPFGVSNPGRLPGRL